MSADARFSAARTRPAPSLSSAPTHQLRSHTALHYTGERFTDQAGSAFDWRIRLIGVPSSGTGATLNFPSSSSSKVARRDEEWWKNEAQPGHPGWSRAVLDQDMDVNVDTSLLPTLEDEGELLPSAAHPSYPTGRPRRGITPYVSEPKLSPLLHNNLALLNGTREGGAGHSGRGMSEGGDKDANEGSETTLKRPLTDLPAHLALRAATDVAPARPTWPFKAYGPGPGGASSLQRFEQRHPQRAEREIWADLGLSEFLPRGREADPLRNCVGDARHELPDFGGVDADASQAIAALAAEAGTSTGARQRASLLLDSGISRAETARRELQRLEAELDRAEALGQPTDNLLEGWTDFELHAGRMESRWGVTRPSMRPLTGDTAASSRETHAVASGSEPISALLLRGHA